ncbi:MAG: hypothetical protein Q8M03_01750 [Legionella sp.]|nr:hypothetical protein [Legionella sp.]
MSKWKKFHSTYSPVDISKADTGNANLREDWFRESGNERMTINGISIKQFTQTYDFKKIEDIESFFKDVILKDMKSASKEKKQEIVDYLKTSFHQGGFMYPVSSSLAVSMNEYSEQDKKVMPYAIPRKPELTINIVTTNNGFKVQEFVKAKDCIVSENFVNEYGLDKIYPVISPDEGHENVIEAQGTINIDFSGSGKEPKVDVESNTISYGHSAIRDKMDKRGLGQIIVDFLKNIVGLNKVQDISSKVEQQAVEPEQESTWKPSL